MALIVDSIWRLVPYLLLSTAVWMIVTGLVVLFRSVEGSLTLWFWLRLAIGVTICYASCLWIHRRYENG